MGNQSGERVLHFILSLAILVAVLCGNMTAQQSGQALVTQAVNNAARTTLAGNVHPLARAEFDRGEAPVDMPLRRMLLVLKRGDRQEVALQHFVENQQAKGSPEFHQWLNPEEFGTRFGPIDSDIAAVVSWLTANGFAVSQVSQGRTVIEFSGSVGQVKQAFGASIHKFLVNGKSHWGNVTDPSVPSALAPVVAGINSLHDFEKKSANQFLGIYSQQTKSLSSNPLVTLSSGNFNDYAVGPYDFATIYDLLPLWNASPTPINGSGQTIVIVGRTDIDPTDATDFWSLFGLDNVHAPQPTLVITHDGPPPGLTGDESEADIDTQWAGAAAPGATINFVTAESTETTDGVDLSALYAVDNNVASIISDSYGQCEAFMGTAGMSFYYSLWEQAAAQGISVFVGTGDSGAAVCDDPNGVATHGLAVSGLASTPFNAAVGGTDFNEYNKWTTYWNTTNAPVTQKSAKSYIPETTWNDSCTNSLMQFLTGGTTNAETNCNNSNFSQFLASDGGSGGVSATWLKPSWQTNTPADNGRDLPDVSLFASNGFLGSYYLICQKDLGGGCDLNTLGAFGGTSVATPAFAGIMALVNQKAGTSQGVPGFVLYKLAASKPSAFHDVPAGSTIAMPCLIGTPNCTIMTAGHQYGVLSGYATAAGYDLATGLGSVNVANLVNNWNTVTFTPSTTALTLNSGVAVNVAHGSSVPVGITLTPGSPAPTGGVALLVNPGRPGNPGFDVFNLSSGAVSSTTSVLPGGSYGVIAHYSGDSKYGGSYSAPVSVTVNPENSSVYMPGVVTNVDSTGNPLYATTVIYATPYLLRADVRNSHNAFCSPPPIAEVACPTGNVTFTDNGNPLDGGSFGLNGLGFTEDQAIQLSGGTHTLAAQYGGDASFNPSSVSSVITVTRAPASLYYPSFIDPNGTVGVPLTINVSLLTNSYGAAPTGTVTFYSNGTQITGTASYSPVAGMRPGNGSGNYASLNARFLSSASSFPAPGNYGITANYGGDQNYIASTSYPTNLLVLFPTPALNLQSSANPISPGSTITLTATVVSTSHTVAPTGTVSIVSRQRGTLPGAISYSTVTDQSGNLNLQATASDTLNFNDTYVSTYSGDTNYPNNTGVILPVSVTGSDFSLNFTQSQIDFVQGQDSSIYFMLGLQSGTAPISIAPTGCSGLPAESSCSFGLDNFTTGGSYQFDLRTTAPHQVISNNSVGSGLPRLWAVTFGLGAVGIILLGGGRRGNALLTLMLCAFLSAGVSCGGGGSTSGGGGSTSHLDPGTPTGTYTITVTGKSGSVSHSASFTLIVH